MKTETYKGRTLKTTKGREYGYVQHSVNGVSLGRHLGNEESALDYMRRSIDFIDQEPVNGDRWAAEWYAPGTFEMCDEGHAKEIGKACRHSWCVEQRASVAPTVEATSEEHVPAHEVTGACQHPTELNRYGLPSRVCGADAVEHRPDRLFVRYVCADHVVREASRPVGGVARILTELSEWCDEVESTTSAPQPITDRFGRVWEWKQGDVYRHGVSAVPKALIPVK
ncbi:hypothetical protein OTB20_08650 [Streptomyces sp. H27-H1]|uniref:hypothetical protein n=1 Tax=Streptomyces sp. H27-H1 TaxID=2996461 RepID=UPI00226D645B|nr:hypothetical protein [Streptomyces sp. H27-H1]MCY0926275.1 hypothetical protein [Streptomyces sp. H27-H1]